MADKYIVFDVETPNRYNERMSAIGITVVEDGEIAKNIYTLVDPEQPFDLFNMALTGITPQMTAGKPNFPELWSFIEPVMSDGILIAHNAPFDMSVLAKCLSDYGIFWKDKALYACTCAMGRKCYPEFPDHKLNTMCARLGISLDHHNAGSDSQACAGLLLNYLNRGFDTASCRRLYDMINRRTLRIPKKQ